MSPSRLSLCAAIGALAITAFAVAPLRAAEDAVIIPAPAADVQASGGIQWFSLPLHFTLQPSGLVISTAGLLPARRASTASRSS